MIGGAMVRIANTVDFSHALIDIIQVLKSNKWKPFLFFNKIIEFKQKSKIKNEFF